MMTEPEEEQLPPTLCGDIVAAKEIDDDRGHFSVYGVEVSCGPLRWTVWRRYSQFLDLHHKLCEQHPEVRLKFEASFPSKMRARRFHDSVIREREAYLGKYIHNVSRMEDAGVNFDPRIRQFLEMDHVSPVLFAGESDEMVSYVTDLSAFAIYAYDARSDQERAMNCLRRAYMAQPGHATLTRWASLILVAKFADMHNVMQVMLASINDYLSLGGWHVDAPRRMFEEPIETFDLSELMEE